MRTTSLLAVAGLLASLPLSVHAKIERVIEKSFSVSPGGKLHVATQGGNIRVVPGSGSEVKVVATQSFRTDDESEADEIAKNLTLEIEQSGSDVSASSKYNGPKLKSWFSLGGTPVSVSFEVFVPEKYSADLHTSGGSIDVGNLTGEVQGRTSGGNIRLARIDGNADVRTSGGNIDVAEVRQKLNADTSGGHIRVAKVVGDANLDTSGGNIAIEDAAGRVNASTSGGNVHAVFSASPVADCTLRTSGGNVSARVPSAAAFKLDARTSGGSVRLSDVTIRITEGAIGKSKIVGEVNGGGPLLKLSTSGGNVSLAMK